jgi:hypothetical protein
MPQPDVYSVHVDRPLTNISVAYRQEATHFIATQAFPVISVDKRSDKYFVYTQADWFRDEARHRADATESAGSGYGLSTEDYSCNVFALHKDIGDQTIANSDNPINNLADATRFLTQKMLLKQETEWVSDYFATSKWGTDKTGGTNFTQWNNYATSDPIEDIELGKETILQNTGLMPNTLILGYQAFRKLKQHPQITSRLQYVMAIEDATVDGARLASIFGVQRVLVAKSVKNAAVENATDNYSFILGKNALLAHVASDPAPLTPSAGYTFMWRGVSKGLGANVGVKTFRMEELSAVRVEAEMAWDNKLVASALGYYFSGAVA